MIERLLIYDPVPFKGGSKKVMQTIISELPPSIEVWVISNDRGSWGNGCNDNVHFVPLFSPRYLQNKTTGILYFLKHFVYLLSLITNMMKLKRFTKIIGFSGPNVDLSIYLLTELINIDIIQLIQGDIAHSKVAGFGLARAKKVFYLPSTHASILHALKSYRKNSPPNINDNMEDKKFIAFVNGINDSTITAKNNNDNVGFLWAGSLLKWKRVELFIAAMARLNSTAKDDDKYFASVCYIKPENDAYVDINSFHMVDNIYWYPDPKNLNDIRANSSVFISTSQNEPFGLSILESMVAGLAIVIPADNAYWDQHLTDGFDCVKYAPNNMESLAKVLTRLIEQPTFLLKISQQAKNSSQKYCHLHCYAQILKCIPN
ncbi:glycosyltransferase family 4 protein [Colwellia piezophila]|uniref:glycosyltransferase family 4 protein n=1 Tax=Colwellia piezophila TaxID=211668 RepID=UPI00037781B5|nr:glycosyltransferase family 4 protein [Colwellia piezophila]